MQKRNRLKRYLYKVMGAEITTTAHFFDECIQVDPLKNDQGQLLHAIKCPSKKVCNHTDIPPHRKMQHKRISLLFNGNFNYLVDIQNKLNELYPKLSRHSRLFIVAYNPFYRYLYDFLNRVGLRKAPSPDVFVTENDFNTFCRLAGYEIVRLRPSVYIPFYIPIISNLLNRILPVLPIIRRLSFLWLVVLRPIIPEQTRPSLSIIIPARNESGNIKNALDRIPHISASRIEIIFVEGNSTDNTWESIQEMVSKPHEKFSVTAFKQPGKGKNDAVRVGFAKATCDLVTILDADLTMPPEMLNRFYEAYCKGLGDFINGSRLVYPMENEAMRTLNRIGNISFAKILSWVLGLKIGDSLCGTKFYSLDDYRRIEAWRDKFGDFDPFGDFEMLFAASELALGVIDVPIRYRSRTYGETNINRFYNGYELIRMTTIGFFRVLLGKTK